MTVRKATEDDIFDIMPLIKMFYHEGGYTDMKYDPKYVSEIFLNYLRTDNCETFLYESDGQVVAMLVASIVPQPFNKSPAAYEIAWYVHPDSRGSSAAIRVYKAFEEWAKENNCSLLSMSRIEGLDDENLIKMYDKMDLKLREHIYMKEL